MRTLIPLLLLALVPAVGVAQKGKAKPKEPDWYLVSAGDRFVTHKAIVAASDFFEAGELTKSINAQDDAGIRSMIEEKRAIVIAPGATIIILEIGSKTAFPEVKCQECRVVKDGKAIGKYPIHNSHFNSDYMKPEKPR